MRALLAAWLAVLAALFAPATSASGAEISVLATGATRAVVRTIATRFEAATGHRVVVQSDTAGGVGRRISGGEAFDVVVGTPAIFRELAPTGRVILPARSFATTGIGVGVREGDAVPDVSTVEAFKAALFASRRGVAFVDPASGGTSGIYVAALFERLGIAEALRDRYRLKRGGYAAELVVGGEADVVIHQISEIIPVAGVRLVGPLPEAIQLITTYQAAAHVGARDPAASAAFTAALASPEFAGILAAAGMMPPKP